MSKLVFTMLLGFTTAAFTGQALAQGGSWATKAPMPTPRYLHGASVVNGIIYRVGGTIDFDPNWPGTVDAYDPATDTWTTKASLMPTPRTALATGVVNGVIYAVGGYNGSALGTVEAYDPATDTWTTKASMPTARYLLSISVVNGLIYAIGGTGPGDTVEAYDPATDTWTTKASMPTARAGLGTSVVNGVIYAIGGTSPVGTVEAYNPATDSWTAKTSMPTARAYLGTSVVNGVVYAIGGRSNGTFVATNEAYDPASDTWTTVAPMPTARDELSTSVVNGVVYAIGGGNGITSLATNEAFTPAYTAQIQQPINSDGSSVFNAKRGVIPVKFTLSQGGTATCALPPATIALTRTAGATTGTVDESVYIGSADTGSNFRIASCQYIYNLSAGALGVGTYRVDIKINGQVVGSAIFKLK